MSIQRNRRAVVLLGSALLLVAAFGAEEENWDAPSKKWLKGPVEYLVTEDEEKEFKKLPDDEARTGFIDEFWKRRDPTPDTEVNEFRERFYLRVSQADEALRKQGMPEGWRSDPGRVLILLGQPEKVETSGPAGGGASAPPATGSAPDLYGGGGGGGASSPGGGGSGGTLMFLYPDLTRLGLPKNLEITFQGEGLSYRLTTRVDLATNAIRGLDPAVLAAEFPAGSVPEKQLTMAPGAAPVPSAAPGAAPTGVVSVQRQAIDAVLLDSTDREDIPVEGAVDFYKALAGKTYVAITVGLPEADAAGLGLDPSSVHPIAALSDVADPENLFLYDSDDLFAPSNDGGADGLLRFQAGDGVKPGRYRVTYGFVTDDGEKVGVRVQDVDVPDFEEGGVKISSLTLATKLETTDQGSGELKRPYILGNRKVVPRVDPKFPLDSNLTLYYQVYNATEGADGHPNLRISYNFYQKRGSTFRKAGTPPPEDGVKDRVIIYELPLSGWPKGEYKIKVTVTDNLNGTFTEQELPFQVG